MDRVVARRALMDKNLLRLILRPGKRRKAQERDQREKGRLGGAVINAAARLRLRLD